MNKIDKVLLLAGFLSVGTAAKVCAQEKIVNPPISYAGVPGNYRLAGLQVSGVEGYEDYVLTNISGLQVGQEIEIPGNAVTDAVKRYWKHGLFSDVSIAADSIVGNDVYLHIYLKTRPRVSTINYSGVKKSEQTDLLQALYGRNGESPMPVIAATSPADCFDAAYQAAKMSLEHLTPVILLTDAFIANGSAAWKLPKMAELDEIKPHYATEEQKYKYTPYVRDPESKVRYWAIPGQEGYTHILGGLEKDGKTGAISTEPENHNEMSHLRYEKVAKIEVPDLKVEGDADDADLLIVGFGSTYGHLLSTMKVLRGKGHKVALAQFKYINPLPANTAEVLMKYKKVVVAEQNLGQLAALLRIRINGFTPYQFDQVKGQPFVVNELVSQFEKLILVREELKPTSTFDERML